MKLPVNLVNFTDTGSAHWIAANGDSIDSTFVGSAELSDLPGVVPESHGNSHHYWWDGSIRGSPGELYRGALHKLQASGVAGGDETHVTFGSFHGTITSPGAAH